MPIYKYTSIKEIIAKVMADNDIQEGSHRLLDWVTWGGEALEKIGAFPHFVNKVSGKNGEPVIEIENYQARLPFDFHRLSQISYAPSENGPYSSMRVATGSFERTGGNPDASTVTGEVLPSESALVTLAMTLYDLSYSEALAKINNEPATRSVLSGILKTDVPTSSGGTNLSNTVDYTYTINDSWIKTNIETGYLVVAYQAIPTDADGYPQVPDDQSFKDALYWYISMKLMYPKWASGQIRDAVYFEVKRSWNYYCKQAYGNSMMPDADMMESVKNSWLRLVPNINAHKNFYSTIGEQEVIYNSHNI